MVLYWLNSENRLRVGHGRGLKCSDSKQLGCLIRPWLEFPGLLFFQAFLTTPIRCRSIGAGGDLDGHTKHETRTLHGANDQNELWPFTSLSSIFLAYLPSQIAPKTMSAIAKRSLLVVLCAQVCTALYAAKGSPCAVSCNSTGGSWVTDLVCSTDDFASTTKGQTLQSCLECTVDSTYVNSSYTDGNSDQFWMLCKSRCRMEIRTC